MGTIVTRRGIGDARGAALLNTLLILGMLGALVTAYAVNVRAHLGLRGGSGIERSGFYSAEGGLNVGVTRFANIFRASGVPETADFQQTVTVGRDTANVQMTPITNCTPCPPTTIPQGELFAGLYSIPYRYTVESKAMNAQNQMEADVAGQFDIHTIPIFQFLAFINDHLFIMPLTETTLHGRVHTNSDLYLQPDETLTIADQRPKIPDVQISAVGDVYRGGRKYDADWRCGGTVTIDKLEDIASPSNDLDPKVMACTSGTGPQTDATLAGWKGNIKQGVLNIITPDVGIINRGTGEYWDRADLRVVMNLDQRASINFGAAGLCPGLTFGTSVSPVLPIIEVQDRAGVQDTGKTRQLWRFMCERRGSIFFNDVPDPVPGAPNGNAGFVDAAARYNPNFANSNRIYRRAGEDTNGDGSLTSKDKNDDVCPIGILTAPWWRPPSCPWPLSLPSATSWFNDMDYRRGAFWNHREQQWMYLLNVNVRALIEWNAQNGDALFPRTDTTDFGLVIFFSVKGALSNAAQNNYGVRIFDSADLDTRNTTFPTGATDPTGLTVVSDQGMIVQGNYNTKDKQPAAILSDAQWVLSQGWEVVAGSGCTGPSYNPGPQCHPNDRKSVFDLDTGIRDVPSSDLPGGLGGQGSFTGSTALGINAALLFGLGPSTRNPDWYNGGLENFPRFLESWDEKTMNYRGSFVSLGRAQHKLANWACGSGDDCLDGVYDPPERAYDYDADFNTVEKLPPMTPKIVYVQQLLYTRIYN